MIERCVFINNAGGTGGAIFAQGPATITDCVFINNSVEHTEYGGLGGGIAVRSTAAVKIANCMFYGCSSENKGGAVFIDKGGSASFINCTFSGNTADDGSGFCLSDAGPVDLVNIVIAFGGPDAAVSGSGDVDISYCNVFGNAGGDWAGPIAGLSGIKGNISVDPLFVDAEAGDLHLRYGSPCRESGDGSTPGLPGKDWEGDPRPAYGSVDMGADEFHTHLYCTGEAAPNKETIVKAIGLPLRITLLCVGTGVLDPPLPTKYGDWFLQYPIVLADMGPTSWAGWVELKARISPDYPVPSTVFLQAFVRDELTNVWVMEIR